MTNAASTKQRKMFTGPKVSDGVPLTSPLLADALIQACLDPQISRIELLDASSLGAKWQPELFVVLHSVTGRRLVLDLVDEERPRDLDAYGLFLVAAEDAGLDVLHRSKSDIAQEPLSSNCRIVWSHANQRVAIGDRIRIMQMLADEGPLRVGDIVRSGTYRGDPSVALMALACHDVVELDLADEALGPGTKVRIRGGSN